LRLIVSCERNPSARLSHELWRMGFAGMLFGVKTNFEPHSVTLAGSSVLLKPLELDHAGDLAEAGSDASVWRYLPIAPPQSKVENESWIRDAIEESRSGEQIPFAIRLQETGRAIGSTRYLDIQRENSALEIGWTWVGKDWQRTIVNTECKFLLLRHAFETLGALRVQLKTDGRNEQSQKAIARIGAKREGTLRKNRRLWDGFVRDTVVFSVLDSEWPGVKRRLEERMSAS